MTVFGDRGFEEVINVKGGHNLTYWCLYKKRKRHEGCVCTEKRQPEEASRGRPTLAKETGLRGDQPY